MTDDTDDINAIDPDVRRWRDDILKKIGVSKKDMKDGIPINLESLKADLMEKDPMLLALAARLAERLVKEIMGTLAIWDERNEGDASPDVSHAERHMFMVQNGRLSIARDELHDIHEFMDDAAKDALRRETTMNTNREATRVEFLDLREAMTRDDVDNPTRDATDYAATLAKTREEALRRVRARKDTDTPTSDG